MERRVRVYIWAPHLSMDEHTIYLDVASYVNKVILVNNRLRFLVQCKNPGDFLLGDRLGNHG